jgi:hypothetical protein
MSPIGLSNVLAFLAFVLCAGIHAGAEARTPGQSDACHGMGDEHGGSAVKLRDCAENHEAWPTSELRALGPDGSPEEAGLDAPFALNLTFYVVPILRFARDVSRVGALACTAQPFESSALPRGPPGVRS